MKKIGKVHNSTGTVLKGTMHNSLAKFKKDYDLSPKTFMTHLVQVTQVMFAEACR